MAAITKYHRLGGLNNRNLFDHSSGDWKTKIKVLAGLVSPEGHKGRVCSRPPVLGLQMAALLLPLPLVVPLYTCTPGVSLYPNFLLLKDISPIGLELTHMNLFNLTYLFNGPGSKYSHVLRYWGLGLQHMTFEETIQHITPVFSTSTF